MRTEAILPVHSGTMKDRRPKSSLPYLMLVALGTFQLGISYVLYAKAIQKVRAFQAVLITMLEPILNPLWVFLLHGEVPGRWALAGGAIVMVTLVSNGLTTGRK